jgi:transposase
VGSADRLRLERTVRDRNAAQKHVWRAAIILLGADGVGTAKIMRLTNKSKTCVSRWQERFMEEGVDGLLRDKTRPSRIPPLGSEVAARVVALTLTDPPVEATHWTAPMMATAVGISESSVRRIWRSHGLQPHRYRQFKLSNDPNFIDKLRDVVGFCVDPPAHAIVLSVDEKSQIQALDRTQPAAHEEGPPGHYDPRLQAQRNHDALRRFERTRWDDHRTQHATPPTPGVHSLPERD